MSRSETRGRSFSPPAKNTILLPPSRQIRIERESRDCSLVITINQLTNGYGQAAYFFNGCRPTILTTGQSRLFIAPWDQFFRRSRPGRPKAATLHLWHPVRRHITEWMPCERGLLRSLSRVLSWPPGRPPEWRIFSDIMSVTIL